MRVDPFQSRRTTLPLITTRRRRISLDLSSGGRLDVSLGPEATIETIEALRAIGEATLARMARFGDATAAQIGEQQLEQRP